MVWPCHEERGRVNAQGCDAVKGEGKETKRRPRLRWLDNIDRHCRLNCRRVLVSPPPTPFGGFKRPKGVRGTSGRSVNIDIRLLRILLRIDALIRN